MPCTGALRGEPDAVGSSWTLRASWVICCCVVRRRWNSENPASWIGPINRGPNQHSNRGLLFRSSEIRRVPCKWPSSRRTRERGWSGNLALYCLSSERFMAKSIRGKSRKDRASIHEGCRSQCPGFSRRRPSSRSRQPHPAYQSPRALFTLRLQYVAEVTEWQGDTANVGHSGLWDTLMMTIVLRQPAISGVPTSIIVAPDCVARRR